jgi:hypothetical protein
VRITGRQAMGVVLCRVSPGEQVTSVFPVIDSSLEEAGEENGAAVSLVPPEGREGEGEQDGEEGGQDE